MTTLTRTVNDAVAAELRAALGRKGLTGAALARVLDFPPIYVSRRLSAAVAITVEDLVVLCEGLGVEPLDVLAEATKDR